MDEDDFKERRGRLRRKGGSRRRQAEGAAEGPGEGDPPPPPALPGRAPGLQPPPPAAGALGGAGAAAGGGVRCQLCGLELSGLGAARRQRHANRCLDDMERLRVSSTSSISECPLCRKAFSTLESRGSHLKRCATSMAIPPPLMLQVVRQQSSTHGSGLPTPPSALKRKVSSPMEHSAKKRKTCIKMGAAEEDLLVAMAMSRSLHEEEETKARLLISGNKNRPQPGRKNPGGGKKNRVKPPHSPPTLLLQDPEEARRQTAERVALLLSEVDEFPSTPPLPPSRLMASELSGKENCPLAVSKGPASSLWERSSLIGLSALGPGGVAGLPLPTLPWQTDQRPMPSTALGLVIPEVEEKLLQESGYGRDLPDKSPGGDREGAEGCSQEEEGALNDLMELAGEGLTLTQWNPAVQQPEERGQEWVPGDVSQSSLNKLLEKPLPLGICSPSFLLASLASAFKGMVNNPHLSDIQVQVDSGELFYAHLFVLYARCPQLMEVVDQTGIWVSGRGEEVNTRRVLLSDVSGEAARVFLNYLYTAEHFIPQRVLSDVAALATRFGMAELVALCTNHTWSGQTAIGDSGQEEEEKVEKFEELLKSIWVGEEEEDKVLVPEDPGSENVVDEQELEEIYEFAATQRKAWKEEERHSSVVAETGAMPGDSSGGEESLGTSQWQGQGTREEVGPSFPLELLQGSEEQRPLGAAGRGHGEALPELAEASRLLGEQSLPAVAWEGESLELFHQSYSGREPINDAAREDLAVMKASTPLRLEKGLLLLPRDFPSGGSQVLADKFSASSPKQRGGFASDLSLALFSPALQEARGKPCQLGAQQRATSAGTAASSVADTLRDAPVPLCSPVDLEVGPEKWQTEAPGFLPKDGSLGLEGGIPCAQSRGVPLRGMLLGAQAGAGDERIHGPGTPPLSPNDAQVGKLSSASVPEARAPGDAQDSHPTQTSAVVLSLERQSLFPRGHQSPSSSACLPRDEKPVADVVVILDDSEEEVETAAQLSWGSSVLEAELPFPEDDVGRVFGVASPAGLGTARAGSCQQASPPRSLLMRNSTPTEEEEEGRCPSHGTHRQRLDLGDQSEAMPTLPLAQRLPVSKTPDLVCREGKAPCTTPLTPMPSYSIMETPVLKKELSRFGVRTLPKPQMVLKLKEIFQYTHRRSESRDGTASSQLGLSHGTQAALRPPSTAACTGCPGPPQWLLAGGCLGGSSRAGDQGPMAKQGCLPPGSTRRKRAVDGAQHLVASQKADLLSGASSDTSLVLRSSSTEFETSLLTEEEEEEEDTPSCRSTRHEADMLVALRQYIYSRPALCRQILFYQPFELARLQSELKQNGIRIALGRLLEFLDTHGITFTTAAARREKQKQRRLKEGGKRRR